MTKSVLRLVNFDCASSTVTVLNPPLPRPKRGEKGKTTSSIPERGTHEFTTWYFFGSPRETPLAPQPVSSVLGFLVEGIFRQPSAYENALDPLEAICKG
jgi:hypothetical protein